MFEGYDPNRRAPYSQQIIREINGKKYVVTYYVSNGYGGSIHVSSSALKPYTDEDVNEENINR